MRAIATILNYNNPHQQPFTYWLPNGKYLGVKKPSFSLGGKETGFLVVVVGWVKRSDTQQIQVYKLGDRSPFLKFVVRRLGKAKRHPTNSGIQIGDRSPFLKFVGWVKRSDTQQIQVYK
ncbi:hypothetical protein AP9108_07475 [Arthrospira sp. PCC 9108]|nr:hypothetical protein AP9108_07475 [Arthrospira sp. PCC 9108]